MEIKKNLKKIVILIVLLAAIAEAYSIWKSYNDQKGLNEGEKVEIVPSQIIGSENNDTERKSEDIDKNEPTPDDRDNQRLKDLAEIGFALDQYAKFNKNLYPETSGYEKISDENNYINKLLRQNGYLKKTYKDPLEGTRYYGYKSDGKSYELSALFEDGSDIRCQHFGELCIYVVRKP